MPERAGARATRHGSLCTGYGGLDLAVHDVFGGKLVWLAEYEDAPAQVCAARFPGVPNLHDITTLDWQQVPPVDVLTAGYPCQPFSQAGRRKGTDDHRHLWPYIADAVRHLRPGVVVLENVAGHLALGFDTVLADLAALGFDAEWQLVRASDVGACHQRARLFILATDPSGAGTGRHPRAVPRTAASGGRPGADVHAAVDAREDATDTDGQRQQERVQRHGQPVGPVVEPSRGDDAHRLVTAPADADGEAGRRDRQGSGPGALPRAEVDGRQASQPRRHDRSGGPAGAVDWGDYGPAIERHERVLGRPAPVPVDDRGRLSPRFVEWMQMLPDGWVTDIVTARTKALKCLGNGVVPPQAAYALRLLLAREAVAA